MDIGPRAIELSPRSSLAQTLTVKASVSAWGKWDHNPSASNECKYEHESKYFAGGDILLCELVEGPVMQCVGMELVGLIPTCTYNCVSELVVCKCSPPETESGSRQKMF